MFSRKNVALLKPKKLHSLEYLKYLYTVLQKNATTTSQNCDLVVEALRLIAEILIWGDQNDSTIMDYFLEENIFEYFVKYIEQNPARDVNVQVLQTLNILFENITSRTALYYLLSNSHTNKIITATFDLSDDEVIAYYISFLKTLSLRLNPTTIHFFYNEQLQKFSLYVQSLKLFHHPENMVRIAVRVITLNILRVGEKGALQFIHRQTSLAYFSQLVWSLGLIAIKINDSSALDLRSTRSKVADSVAEHIDYMHYIEDLFSLNIDGLNHVLCDQLLRRLLIPLYVYSLTKPRKNPDTASYTLLDRQRVSLPVAAFVLAQIFSIISHSNLIKLLSESIILGSPALTDLVPFFQNSKNDPGNAPGETTERCKVADVVTSLIQASVAVRASEKANGCHRLSSYLQFDDGVYRRFGFNRPLHSMDDALAIGQQVSISLFKKAWPKNLSSLNFSKEKMDVHLLDAGQDSTIDSSSESPTTPNDYSVITLPSSLSLNLESSASGDNHLPYAQELSVSDDTGSHSDSIAHAHSTPSVHGQQSEAGIVDSPHSWPPLITFSLQGRPFLRSLYRALEAGSESDHRTLFALILITAIRSHEAVDDSVLEFAGLSSPKKGNSVPYDAAVVSHLLNLVATCCKSASLIRPITLRLAFGLLTDLVYMNDEQPRCLLMDEHFAQLCSAREEATLAVRSYFQINAIFLDLFETQVRNLQKPLVINKLLTDYSLLIPPTAASLLPSSFDPSINHQLDLSTLDLDHRLPQSEIEHAQRAITVFLIVHIWLYFAEKFRLREGECVSSSPVKPYVVDNENIGIINNPSLPKVMFSDRLQVDLDCMSALMGLSNIPDVGKIGSAVLKTGDKLDLTSETLIKCTVEHANSQEKRYIVNYSQQLVLVEPDSKQLGWGVVTFIGPLQDVEVACDPGDIRRLHITVHTSGHCNFTSFKAKPLLAARFLFEDHIRCMTARHLLLQGRETVRQNKLRKIASLLDFSPEYIRENFPGPSLANAHNASSASDFHATDRFTEDKFVKYKRPPATSTQAQNAGISNSLSSSGLSRLNLGETDKAERFLLERQNRHRSQRAQDSAASGSRIPLVPLAGYRSTVSRYAVPSTRPAPVQHLPIHFDSFSMLSANQSQNQATHPRINIPKPPDTSSQGRSM